VDRPARQHFTATGSRCFPRGSLPRLEYCRSVHLLKSNCRDERFPGCGQLSTLEEQLVLIFTEVRSDDNNRLTVTINQAYKVKKKSSYRHRIHVTEKANRELGTANISKRSQCYLNPMSGADYQRTTIICGRQKFGISSSCAPLEGESLLQFRISQRLNVAYLFWQGADPSLP
jgi:hypothetical protein